MKLRFMNGRLSGHMVDVLPTGFVIGRGDSSDLAINEEGVSRRHARIFFEDGTWFVEDLGSTNGVRVNGTKVAGRFCIKPGDRIGIFTQTLLFSGDADVVDVDNLGLRKAPDDSPDVDTVIEKAPPLPGGKPQVPVNPAGGTTVAPRETSNMSWLKAVVLLLLVAGLAWFARETLKKRDDEGQSETVEVIEEGAGTEPVLVEDVTESPSVVVEIPGQETPPPDETPVQIVQVRPIEVPPGPEADQRPPQNVAAGDVDLFVQSIPVGAEVFLAGVRQGKTPLLLRNLGEGEYELRLTAAGYNPLVRPVRIPGPVPVAPLVMGLKAGAVKISSSPSGAAIFHGTQYLGTTPCVTDNLPAGSQELRLMKVGYEPLRGTVTVSKTSGAEKVFTMESLLGGIEIITIPAGCNVYIDNVLKGTTQRADETSNKSKPFLVSGLKEGDHLARVEHPNGGGKSDTVKIRRGTNAKAIVELWVIDTKVTLKDGTEHLGMLLSRNVTGDVFISEKATGEKTPKPKQYFNEQILRVTPVGAGEGRGLMETAVGVEAALNGGPVQEALANPVEPNAVQDQILPAEGPLPFLSEDLARLIGQNTAASLTRKIGGREVVLTGVPSEINADPFRAHIHFGKTIVCELSREAFDEVSHELSHSRESGVPITIRGQTVAGEHMVTLRGCTYTPQAK